MHRKILIAAMGMLLAQPESVLAQSRGHTMRGNSTHQTNRAARSRVATAQRGYSAIGTPQVPDFFFANAMRCPDVVPRGAALDLRLQRVPPNGRIYTLTEQQFQKSLKPGVPICVVVHGSFVPANEFGAFVDAYKWIRSGAPHLPLHVVFYRWPSSAGAGAILVQRQVELLGNRAEAHGLRLALFLKRLPQQNPVSILAHSHGTRCASSALHLLGGGRVGPLYLQQTDSQKQYRVVFGAAAIDHHWLNPDQRFGRALKSSEYILNLRTRRDWALGLYPLRNSYSQPALGRVGLTPYDRLTLGDTARKFREIDVTPLVGAGHSERAYVPHITISRSFASWLHFADRKHTANVRDKRKKAVNRAG